MGKLRPINSLSKSVLSTYSVPSSVLGTEEFDKKVLATCLPMYSGRYRGTRTECYSQHAR